MQQYDLQEQEQLATLKHFWDRWGNLISAALLAIVAVVAGLNGYQYWQRSQAAKAAVLYDQVLQATVQNQQAVVQQSLQALQQSFPKTAQASQATLLAGKHLVQQQDWVAAEQAFDWLARHSKDEGFKALAVLHKASVQMQQEQGEQALAALDAHSFPYEFRPLRDDRRGDILLGQGKTQEAISAYQAAFDGLGPFSHYRSVVQSKLTALGQEPAAAAQAPAAAGSSS